MKQPPSEKNKEEHGIYMSFVKEEEEGEKKSEVGKNI